MSGIENKKTKQTILRSLAYAQFEHSMDLESRHYWNTICAIDYAHKWWNSIPSANHPAVLHDASGDNKDPFRRVPLSPGQYLEALNESRNMIRQNVVISFAAAFENYICNVTQRTIFLEPECLRKEKDSAQSAAGTAFTLNDLIEPAKTGQFRYWLSKNMAEKYQRAMTHEKLIYRLNALIQHGLNKDNPDILNWTKYERLRNAIVHADRRVTSDLVKSWPDRFNQIGQTIILRDKDISGISALARKIASAIDTRFVLKVVRDQDNHLLVREIYIRYGIEDPSRVCQIVSSFTKGRVTSKTVESIIQKQKKTGNAIDGYDFDRLFSVFDEANASLVERNNKFI